MMEPDSSADEDDNLPPENEGLVASGGSDAGEMPAKPLEVAQTLHVKSSSITGTGSIDSISIGSSPGSPRMSISSKIMSRQNDQNTSMSSLHLANTDNMEDAEHMKRLQLYVFVSRCIAYPFNAKQPTDMARRQSKVTKQNLTAIKDRFTSFLGGKIKIESDEAFKNAIQSYYDSFLCCDRVHKMVNSGGYSGNDFREIFKANITKRVKSLPDIEGLSKETVLSSWMAKFDAIYRGDEEQKRGGGARLAATAASELILSKEQLYEMFQTILGVKKYKHQILFNACQLDNADEQAACIRRELHSRQDMLSTLSKESMPKFIVKNMEEIFVEEQKEMVKGLMSIHLEGFPVPKGNTEGKSGIYKMKKPPNNVMVMDVNDDNDAALTKAVSGLSFKLQVTVMEASGLKSIRHNRIVFVIMELEGDEKLQTDQAEAGAPLWETQGDWSTSQPLPVLKLRLMAEHSSKLNLSDDKELANLSLTPHCGFPDNYEWYSMQSHKTWNGDAIKLKLSIKMERPQHVKKSG